MGAGASASPPDLAARAAKAATAFGWDVDAAAGDAGDAERLGELEALFLSKAEELDPWHAVPEAEQLRRVGEDAEELEEVEIVGAEENGSAALAEAAGRDAGSQDPADSRLLLLLLTLQGAETTTALGRAEGRDAVVALRLQDNATPLAAMPSLAGLPWLRSLTLAACAPPAPLDLVGLRRLLVLDLSFTVVPAAAVDLAPVGGTLVRLVADGCEWTALPRSVAALERLEVLSAQDNAIADATESVLALAGLARLRELDLRENLFQESGAANVRAYTKLARETCPALRLLDNKLLNEAGAGMALASIGGLREDMNRMDTVADQNEDRGSCSCLEGEPCQVEYTCKDWKHRFAIAAASRNA